MQTALQLAGLQPALAVLIGFKDAPPPALLGNVTFRLYVPTYCNELITNRSVFVPYLTIPRLQRPVLVHFSFQKIWISSPFLIKFQEIYIIENKKNIVVQEKGHQFYLWNLKLENWSTGKIWSYWCLSFQIFKLAGKNICRFLSICKIMIDCMDS